MRPRVFLIAVSLSACATRAGIRERPVAEGAAEVFAPGVLSTGNVFRGSFTPDQHEFYFFKRVGDDPDVETYRIFRSIRHDDGGWTAPEIVTLGEPASDLYPVIHPDGRYMIFASYRPAPGDTSAHPSAHLWRADREGDGWDTPVFLASVSAYGHYHPQPAFDAHGALRFKRQTADYEALGEWRAEASGDDFRTPEPSDEWAYWRTAITDPLFLWETTAGHDDTYILLVVSERDTETRRPGPAELWVAFREPGGWSSPRPLAGAVNTREKTENFAFFNPAGDTLYFVRDFAEFLRVPLAAALGSPLKD